MNKTRQQHFEDVVADVLASTSFSLPPDQANLCVQQAHREIADGHEWYHQRATGHVIINPTFSGGLATFTRKDRLVTIDTEITTYLAGLLTISRLSVIGPDQRLYDIAQFFEAEQKVYLATEFFGQTAVNVPFTTCVDHIPVPFKSIEQTVEAEVVLGANAGKLPDTTFRAFVYLEQIKYSPYVVKRRLLSSTRPTSIHPYKVIDGVPYFQLCDVYTGSEELIIPCTYLTTGGDFCAGLPEAQSYTPLAFSTELITALAISRLALWAEANKGLKLELQKTNWMVLHQTYFQKYYTLRSEAIRRDYELASLASSQITDSPLAWIGQSNGQETAYPSGIVLDNNRIIL